jgi:REP element-mobilizing transposase RayT
MPQSLARNLIHLIFSTKHRARLIRPDVRPDLHAYLAGIFKQWESPAIIIGSVEDHVHALFALSKNHALSKIVEEVKRSSSKWIKTLGDPFAAFYWQNGYGAFSVSPSLGNLVERYIADQERHHRTMTFQDEFRAFCRRHGVAFDERFVWD